MTPPRKTSRTNPNSVSVHNVSELLNFTDATSHCPCWHYIQRYHTQGRGRQKHQMGWGPSMQILEVPAGLVQPYQQARKLCGGVGGAMITPCVVCRHHLLQVDGVC